MWRGGEGYRLDSTVAGAPGWWINTNSPGGPARTNTSTALCGMPAGYLAGQLFTVTNFVTPSAVVGTFGVEDQPPPGWTVSSISDGGVFDSVNGKVKWGLFFDHTTRALTYQVLPAAGAQGQVQFSGQASFDGLATVAIAGQRFTSLQSAVSRPVGGITWLNPAGDIRIKVTGGAGQTWVVETSTNLTSWRALSTNTLDAGGLYSFVESSLTNRVRFYRFRLPNP